MDKESPASWLKKWDKGRHSNDLDVVRRLVFQFTGFELGTRDEIQHFQTVKIKRLLSHLEKHSQFFQNQFNELEFAPSKLETLDELRKLPTITKLAYAKNYEKLRPERLPPAVRPIREFRTSGTSGAVTPVINTNETEAVRLALEIRELSWMGVNPNKTWGRFMTQILDKSNYVEESNSIWNAHFTKGLLNALIEGGPAFDVSISDTAENVAANLVKVNPSYLRASPSTLFWLSSVWEEKHRNSTQIERIRTIGETLSQEWREKIESAFGIPIYDCYASGEGTHMAAQCPKSGLYHIHEENVLLEILNEDNLPCNEGEIGRVVLTSIHSTASPFVRYEIGDFAEVGPKCDCGRPHKTLKRVTGRLIGRLRLPNGKETTSINLVSVLNNVKAIRRYQIRQKAVTEFDVIIENAPGLEESQLAAFKPKAEADIGLPVNVQFRFVDSIASSDREKLEPFIWIGDR